MQCPSERHFRRVARARACVCTLEQALAIHFLHLFFFSPPDVSTTSGLGDVARGVFDTPDATDPWNYQQADLTDAGVVFAMVMRFKSVTMGQSNLICVSSCGLFYADVRSMMTPSLSGPMWCVMQKPGAGGAVVGSTHHTMHTQLCHAMPLCQQRACVRVQVTDRVSRSTRVRCSGC